MSIIHHKHEQLESPVPACYTIMRWPSFSSSGPEMDRNDKSGIFFFLKKKTQKVYQWVGHNYLIILSKAWLIKRQNLSNANLRCCVQGPTNCALAPRRIPSTPVRHGHPAPVTPGSDGGRLWDRRHDELPRRFREKRQKKPTLPLLHRLDAYSDSIVRG